MEEPEIEAKNTRFGTTPTLHGLQLGAGGDETFEVADQQSRSGLRPPVMFKSDDEPNWSEGNTETNQSIEMGLVRRRNPQTPEEGRLEATTEGE